MLNAVLGINLKLDGVIGPNTSLAIRQFQRKNNIIPTGSMNNLTQGTLKFQYYENRKENSVTNAGEPVSYKTIEPTKPRDITWLAIGAVAAFVGLILFG